MRLKNCKIVLKDVFVELIEERNRLLNDLCFERNLNSVLESIRNYSLVLINDCKCNQNSDFLKTFYELQFSYSELKTTKTSEKLQQISEQNIGLNSEIKFKPNIDSNSTETNANIDSNTEVLKQNCNKSSDLLRKTSSEDIIDTNVRNTDCLIDFVCNECYDRFDCELSLELHVNREHRNIESYVCHECRQIFTIRDQFAQHLSLTHKNPVFDITSNDSNPNTTDKPNPNDLKTTHLATGANRTFKCDIKGCNKEYKLLCNLNKHKESAKHHFRCYWLNCKKYFGTKRDLNRHIIIGNHKLAKPVSYNRKRSAFNDKQKPMEETISSYFSQSLSSKANKKIIGNRKRSEKLKKNNNDSNLVENSPKIIRKTTLNLISNLFENSLTENRFQCNVCEERFEYELDLVLHSKRIHKKFYESHVCPKCKSSFLTKDLLSKHMSLKHLIPSFKCDLCSYKAFTKSALIAHKSSHTSEALTNRLIV